MKKLKLLDLLVTYFNMTTPELLQDLTLSLEKRTIVGRDLKKLTRQNMLPGVVYNKETNVLVQFSKGDFVKLFRKLKELNTKSFTTKLENKEVTLKIVDIDINPINNEPRHVDFYLM